MAQTKDWYPQEEAKLTLFADNFTENLAQATELANLPKDTFGEARKSVDEFLDAHAQLAAADKEAARLRSLVTERSKRMETNVRAVAKQLKNTININPEVLSLLELEGTPADPQAKVAAQAPTLVMSVELGVVKGRYVKHGHQAVDVYGCRTGEKDFTLLGRFTLSRFEDRRPNRVAGQPEQRDYYAVYVDKDQQVGQQSATVTVVVGSRPGGEA